jgi:hypothetical protein
MPVENTGEKVDTSEKHWRQLGDEWGQYISVRILMATSPREKRETHRRRVRLIFFNINTSYNRCGCVAKRKSMIVRFL